MQGYLVTQIKWQELANFLQNVEEDPLLHRHVEINLRECLLHFWENWQGRTRTVISLNLVFWLLFKSQALVLWLEFDISLLASSLTTQYKFVVKVLQYSQYYIQQPFKFPQNLKTLHWLTMFSKDFSGSLGGILCLRRPNKITLSGIIILKHTIVRITSV